MKLTDVRDLLLTVGVPVHHYHAEKQDDKYIVWAEDGQSDTLSADDMTVDQEIQGTIDYFTKTEYDENVIKIQEALNGKVVWRLNSVQYEVDTDYIHYEWVFEVV